MLNPVPWIRSFIGVCSNPTRLGVANGRIQDSQVTASSYNSEETRAFFGRLDGVPIVTRTESAWHANVRDWLPWIQVDFLRPVIITAVLTQGDRGKYVKKYNLKYSDDGSTWTKYHEVCHLAEDGFEICRLSSLYGCFHLLQDLNLEILRNICLRKGGKMITS